MTIAWDEPSDSFLLTGDGFSYAIMASSYASRTGSSLRHLYWGAPLARADLARLAHDVPPRAGSNTWSRPRAHHEELVTGGGTRFDESALLVEFADGVAALDLRVEAIHVDGDRLDVRLLDQYHPFQVVLRYEVRGPALVRWVELRNRGDAPVTLIKAASGSWPIPWQPTYTATTLAGGYAAETQVRHQVLGPGRLVLESRRGLPGHAFAPWLAVGDFSVAVAHGGSWKLTAELSGDGHVHVTGGANDFAARPRLAPGESLTLPETVGVYAPAGEVSARWYAYERRFVLPRPQQVRPVLYNSWESTFFDVRHDDQVKLAQHAQSLGVELFVVDDGWFAGRDDEIGGLGDWRADPAKLPAGVAGLADEVHALGMRFGVWVEPESVTPDSDLFREHPDWVYHWPDRPPTAIRHSYGLDFGHPEVQDWAVEWLGNLVHQGHVDFIKWDLNRSLTDAPGTAALRHEAGFRAVVDRLRQAHPDLWLETCASGGGRADLASLSRFELAWPSDNTDAFERLAIQDGYAYVHSPQTMSCWVTDSPGYLSKRPIPLAFRFHVAMTGALGVGGRLGAWPDDDLTAAAGFIARYKTIRESVQLGARYRLVGGPDRQAVCYVHADGGQVAAFVFAQTVRQGYTDVPLRLLGLDPDARYRDADTGTEYGGAFLMQQGLRPVLAGDYASALIVLNRL
jgi:alpha-galactosidase